MRAIGQKIAPLHRRSQLQLMAERLFVPKEKRTRTRSARARAKADRLIERGRFQTASGNRWEGARLMAEGLGAQVDALQDELTIVRAKSNGNRFAEQDVHSKLRWTIRRLNGVARELREQGKNLEQVSLDWKREGHSYWESVYREALALQGKALRFKAKAQEAHGDVKRAAATRKKAETIEAKARKAYAQTQARTVLSARSRNQRVKQVPKRHPAPKVRKSGARRQSQEQEQPSRPSAPEVRSSQESLDILLDQAWAKANEVMDRGSGVIYNMYSDISEPNPRSMHEATYVEALANIASTRPPEAVSNTQDYGGSGDAISSIARKRRDRSLDSTFREAIDNTFYRFQRADWNPSAIKERVYINARSDHAPALMAHIVRKILDNPSAFPGVEMCKVSGPVAATTRAENIVIYTRGREATNRVLNELAHVQTANRRWFMSSVPMMAESKLPGIGIGAEPKGKLSGKHSFGSLRAKAITEALLHTLESGGSKADFKRNVGSFFRRYEIDPQNPHQNLS